jgi:hypothetical protein
MRSSDPGQNIRGNRRRVRRAAVVTAALLAASTAAAGPALAGTVPPSPSWHIVRQVHNGPFGGFTAVTAVGQNGGWAFNQGAAPTAWRRSGSTWTQVKFPGKPNEVVVAAGATSPTDVWAFTAGGAQSRALRWNGRTWTFQRSFSSVDAVALIPGTTSLLGGGDTHAADHPGTDVVAVMLEYGR